MTDRVSGNEGTEPQEILDVVIIGAGLSGIGCAAHLSKDLPNKQFLILERRKQLGGTWDLFKYPGIRSDSDLFTFGYDFRPWESDQCIAPGGDIKSYLHDTADEYGILDKIRYDSAVEKISWDSSQAQWLVNYTDDSNGQKCSVRARWVFGATGYYDYDKGYQPAFNGEEKFRGKIIHPQHWPEDYDYTGEKIAVIGSGATAVTLLPRLSLTASHVYQIQRTPSYVLPVPSREKLYGPLKKLLGDKLAFKLMRSKYILQSAWFFKFCQRFPTTGSKLIRAVGRKSLPADFPYDKHFTPPYDPWDQRLCLVPDRDYFKALKKGSASVVTGDIAGFTADGIEMTSGEKIQVDTIVTATGLNLKLFGGADVWVDGEKQNPSDHVVYKGMMLSNVPNYCFAVGYTTASWTLKIGLLCQQFVKILSMMDDKKQTIVQPRLPQSGMTLKPLLDFKAGYVLRSLDQLPKQGDRDPWQASFSYYDDAKMIKRQKIDDGILEFSTPDSIEQVRES